MAQQIRENPTGFFIPSSLRWLALAAAVLSMGIAMPSCPGQQEMRQQIDALQNNQNDLTRKVQVMDTQIHTLAQAADQQKQAIGEMANVIQAQKAAMDQLNASLQQLNQQVASMSKGSRKTTSRSTSTNKRKGY